MKQIRKHLLYIVLAGLIIRIFFSLFGGEIYYGTRDFKIQGDTYGWIESIQNLIEHGEYTSDLTEPNAHFFRPPGYAFIMGIFYFLAGRNFTLGLELLSWFQIILDALNIYLVANIAYNISRNRQAAVIAAILYACYPFIIVWTPVLYAESISVFLVTASIYFITAENVNNRHLIYSGIFTGLAVLTRLQCIFLLPPIVFLIFKNLNTKGSWQFKLLLFSAAFGLVYGTWPARNYLFQNRLLFSQDLRVGKHWSPDYLSFMDYIFTIKTDHQPQYQQIINNEVVEWPAISYSVPGDSALLAETINKCRTCGTGFSYFKYHAGLINSVIPKDSSCDRDIELNFKKLTQSQKAHNKLNSFLITPLGNLKKALFKFQLYGNKSPLVKLSAAILFISRTILIFLGLTIILLNYKRKYFNPDFGSAVLIYSLLWYLFLSFIYRNMEIRYLLQCDILLLIPSAFILEKWSSNFIKSRQLKE